MSAIGTVRGVDLFSREWLIARLEDAAKYPAQHGIKFNGLTALPEPRVSLLIDGQAIELPDDIMLDGIEFVRVGCSNPWSSKKPDKEDLTGDEINTLIALVENGPLTVIDLPSKSARNSLIQKGLAQTTVIHEEHGFQIATQQGRDVYMKRYGGRTIEEAMSNRKTLMAAELDRSHAHWLTHSPPQIDLNGIKDTSSPVPMRD